MRPGSSSDVPKFRALPNIQAGVLLNRESFVSATVGICADNSLR